MVREQGCSVVSTDLSLRVGIASITEVQPKARDRGWVSRISVFMAEIKRQTLIKLLGKKWLNLPKQILSSGLHE